MHDKPQDKSHNKLDNATPEAVVNPLKSISAAEFAALGADNVAFVRPISGTELVELVPQAEIEPEDAMVHLLMSGDGTPLLVTDSLDAVDDWLEDKPVSLVSLH